MFINRNSWGQLTQWCSLSSVKFLILSPPNPLQSPIRLFVTVPTGLHINRLYLETRRFIVALSAMSKIMSFPGSPTLLNRPATASFPQYWKGSQTSRSSLASLFTHYSWSFLYHSKIVGFPSDSFPSARAFCGLDILNGSRLFDVLDFSGWNFVVRLRGGGFLLFHITILPFKR